MCGIQQAGKIAYKDIKQHLEHCGCVPTKCTPGTWRHLTTNLTFTLIVEDLGIKHTSIAQVKHLIHALQPRYDITLDCAGTLHDGFYLHWDYVNQTVKLPMP